LKEEFINFSVENFVHYIISNNISKQDLESKLNLYTIENKKKEEILKKIRFAYKRMNQPLDTQTKILLIFFPLGIVNIFLNIKGIFDESKQRKLGFVKKVKQFYNYSIIGVIMYTLLIIILLFLNK